MFDSGRPFDLRGKKEFAEASVEESNTGLEETVS